MLPLIRYVGGKRWLAPALVPEIRAALVEGATYHEPFLGGGAVLLNLQGEQPTNAIASDVNQAVMSFWTWVKRDPRSLHEAIAHLTVHRGTSQNSYLSVRAAFNNLTSKTSINAAAMTYYLNYYSFQGLWRENSKGGFNTPFAKDREGRSIPPVERFVEFAACLQRVQFGCRDFRVSMSMVKTGDVVYVDSPYLELKTSADDGGKSFTSYEENGFSTGDHRDLAGSIASAVDRGATVFASNVDVPLVHELYGDWAAIEPITERRLVAAKGDARGTAPCVLIVAKPK